MKTVLAATFAVAMMTSVPATALTVVFEDDFSTYGDQLLDAPDAKFLGNWKTTSGTVDYLAPGGSFGFLCSGGASCVDLDGSTKDSGLFETVKTFAAGVYNVLFQITGSNRGTEETVTISFGGIVRSITLAADAVANQDSFGLDFFGIEVTSPTTLSFLNAGGDNIGILLSSVVIEQVEVAPVPVPAAGGLLLAGLFGLASLRRRKAATV